MPKFKIGDRIRAIRAVDGNEKLVNQTGKIIGIIYGTYKQYGVEFDRPINGHSCCDAGKMNFCWWLKESDFVPATEFKVGQIYKVGVIKGYSGNIIEIADVYGDNVRYKTLKGKNTGLSSFDKNSLFAKGLKLIDGCENKIVITTDGVTTIAKLYEGKKVVKTATAKCNPDDTFNFETGAKIAFDRLTLDTTFDWDEFKAGKIAVKVTKDNFKSFIAEAKKHGLKFDDESFNPFETAADSLVRIIAILTDEEPDVKDNEIYVMCQHNFLKISHFLDDLREIIWK